MASELVKSNSWKPFVKKNKQRGLKIPFAHILVSTRRELLLLFPTMATFPTLHLNGTSNTDLEQEYTAAYHAIGKAIDALAAATLNGRDYYPQADGAYYKARSERDAALEQLRQAQQYAGEMVAGIFDQL
jgi:hypothetical protein